MKKYILSIFITVIAVLPIVAQNLQISEPENIGSCASSDYGQGTACITFFTVGNIELGFVSNVENIKISSDILIGANKQYVLTFNTDNLDANADRKLQITSKQSPQPLEIYPELFHKRSLKYIVSLIPCYKPLMDDGNELFERGKYEDAKEKFLQAKECYDSSQENLFYKKLVITDSILCWKELIKKHENLLEYDIVANYCGKIFAFNNNDWQMQAKQIEMSKKNEEYCNKYVKQANKYYYIQEYEKALIMYKKLTDGDCFYKDSAVNMIKKVERAIAASKDKRGVFTYEYGFFPSDFSLPIGFQIGSYNTKKAGFYWSVFANPKFFNTFREDYYKETVRGNVGTTMGLTFRPIPRKYDKVPIWLHLGLGYSLMTNYQYKDENGVIIQNGDIVNYNSESTIDLKYNPHHIIPFEAGATFKIWYFVLRYTFQYRFCIGTKEEQGFIIPYVHKIGIGFCW